MQFSYNITLGTLSDVGNIVHSLVSIFKRRAGIWEDLLVLINLFELLIYL